MLKEILFGALGILIAMPFVYVMAYLILEREERNNKGRR